MPRSRLDKDSPRAVGITPFTHMSSDSDTEDKPGMMTTVSDGEVTVSWSENNMSSDMLDPKNSSVSEQRAHLFERL